MVWARDKLVFWDHLDVYQPTIWEVGRKVSKWIFFFFKNSKRHIFVVKTCIIKWKTKNTTNKINENWSPIDNNDFIVKAYKLCQYFYRKSLLNHFEPPTKQQERWKEELNTEIVNWDMIYKIHSIVQKTINLLFFNTKYCIEFWVLIPSCLNVN